MPKPIPLSPNKIQAACHLHGKLVGWRRSDEALRAIKEGLPGFSPAVTFAKAAVVNALYYTRVFAIVRVADHFTAVLAKADLGRDGPELVERLGAVPRGGAEKRTVRRLSLAAKFTHFFLDEDRFPIYDRYAVRMVAKHAGISMSSLDGKYVAFARAFNDLAAAAGLVNQGRRLDRFLWIQGQYEECKEQGKASSGELEATFRRGEWPLPDLE